MSHSSFSLLLMFAKYILALPFAVVASHPFQTASFCTINAIFACRKRQSIRPKPTYSESHPPPFHPCPGEKIRNNNIFIKQRQCSTGYSRARHRPDRRGRSHRNNGPHSHRARRGYYRHSSCRDRRMDPKSAILPHLDRHRNTRPSRLRRRRRRT